MHAEFLQLIAPDGRQAGLSDEAEVKINLRGTERSHGHIGVIFGLIRHSAILHDRKSRREPMGSARKPRQLSCGIQNRPRFMENSTVEAEDLVGP
jgi:hypothetical protein